jgi:putative mRNA 3-end processing factor
MLEPLIQLRPEGLYCPAADAYIDPWRPVARALITHAHADHARPGSDSYYAAQPGLGVLYKRLGSDSDIHSQVYGEPFTLNAAEISFHPAGHVLGSAQIRIEAGGQVWVISGDYKRDPDPTCTPFEVLECDVFITEATFGLPIYRWRPTPEVAAEIYAWWQQNREQERVSVLFAYAFGKAQRILAELAAYTDETVMVHGAVETLTEVYRQAGVAMLATETVDGRHKSKPKDFVGRLVIAPPGANGTPWMRRFGACSTGFCSGWMQIRGQQRWRGYDRGFVISDHADWPGLIATIKATGARKILATHGNSNALVRYLNEQQSIEAEPLETGTLYGNEETG